MKNIIPSAIIAALMLLCAWLYYRVHEAEEAAWRATCETVKWQTRANALECAQGRKRP